MSSLAGVLGFSTAALAGLAFLVFAVKKKGLLARPVPFGMALLGSVPALLVLGTWARLFDLPAVRFTHPLLTLPTGAAVMLLAVRLLSLSDRILGVRRTLLELFSALSLITASLAVSGLEIGHPLDRLTVVLAVDRSRSIDLVPNAPSRIEAERRVAELGMGADDRIAVVAFGANALVEDPARPRTSLPSAQRADVARDGTDLSAAIRQALAEVPPDSAARVVLLSDGVSTRGDVDEALTAAIALGIPVDAVPLEQGDAPSVRVAEVRLPPRAAAGQAVALRVVTEASQDAEVEVRVYRDGKLLRVGPATLRKGQDVLYLKEEAPASGLHRYDVEVSPREASRDRSAQDNTGSSFLKVRGPSTALILDRDAHLAAAMAAALRSAAFEVDVVETAGVPGDIGGLARYDLLVLGEIPASDLSPTQLSALGSYVRDLGGGLLLTGGDRALGPGGYSKTPVEEVSPVSFDLKQERRRASLAEVICVDYSGSMAMSAGGKTKLELANEAAARSADLLSDGDRLGVMHVDTEVAWTVPLAPVKDKPGIAAKIRAVSPGGGGILVDLSLRRAYQALDQEQTQLKHLLLFADGGDAEERQNAFSLGTQAKRQGITTSVVALGRGGDVAALSHLAEVGGGRFYLIEDAHRLPTVFAQETILASRSAIHEESFVPSAHGSGSVLRGIDLGSAPPLQGYVVTIPKGRAQIQLSGPEGDPILATWSAGVGRAATFTSDYKDRWGRAWTGWSGAARLFAQLGRDLSRGLDDPKTHFSVQVSGGELKLLASVVDERGQSDVFRRLRVRVAGPDGFARELTLEAGGKSGYEASLGLSRPGAYLATLIDDDEKHALATAGAVLSAGEEMHPTGSDRALLRRVAALTGGKLRDTLAGVFGDRPARRFAYDPLAPLLVLLSAAFLLGAVASRRLLIPRRKRPMKRAAETPPPAKPAAEPTGALQALRAAKERADALLPVGEPGPRPATPRAVLRPPPVTKPDRAPESRGRLSSRPAARKKSAAEILLERRRRRRPD